MLTNKLFVIRHTTVYGSLLLVILACAYPVAAKAQTLDEQYVNYLGSRCANLNFERDTNDQSLPVLPGQAGPQLEAYCSRPLIVAGEIVNNASGGGAGSEVGRGNEDSTLRRRRLRNKNNGDAAGIAADVQTKADVDDFSIIGNGNLSGYIALRYQHEKQDVTHYEGGRRANLYGATIGSDYRVGSTGLLGLAVKLDDLKGDFDSGGDFKTRTQGVMMYGSWYPQANAFIDLTGGMDFASLDTRRVVSLSRTIIFLGGSSSTVVDIAPASAHSAPNSRAIMAEIRAGYDVSLGSVTIGPRLAVITRHSKLDAYIESGATPMTLAFDEQTEKSLRSSLGTQGSIVFTPGSSVIVLQLNLDWLHEFQNDQRQITVHFAEDLRPTPTRFQFLNEAPDRDVLNARLSTVVVFHNGFSGFVSVENLFAHSYLSRFGASVGVRKEF